MAVGCAGAALVAAGCGLTSSSTKTTTVTTTVTKTVTHTVTQSAAANGCTAHDLTGTFQELQGSAGAGNIVYTLKVTNGSQQACTVSGIPAIDFLTSGGSALPSHVTPNGTGAAVLVTLQPGASATSQVRFSPDVDPCDQGAATTLRVTMSAGGTLNVNIDPPTRLCGGGSLQPTNFTGAD
jgi:Protein of unknown function (DUF4232)